VFVFFGNVCFAEPTIVLMISKRVLNHIYNNNKTKLSELRIRMLGKDVGMLHILDHPKGSELFHSYLSREHAEENLLFYKAVDKFDSMAQYLLKQYEQTMKIGQEQLSRVVINAHRSKEVNISTDSNNAAGTAPSAAVKSSSPRSLTADNAARLEQNPIACNTTTESKVSTPPHNIQGTGQSVSPPLGSCSDGEYRINANTSLVTVDYKDVSQKAGQNSYAGMEDSPSLNLFAHNGHHKNNSISGGFDASSDKSISFAVPSSATSSFSNSIMSSDKNSEFSMGSVSGPLRKTGSSGFKKPPMVALISTSNFKQYDNDEEAENHPKSFNAHA
jgi:hypothetical protein